MFEVGNSESGRVKRKGRNRTCAELPAFEILPLGKAHLLLVGREFDSAQNETHQGASLVKALCSPKQHVVVAKHDANVSTMRDACLQPVPFWNSSQSSQWVGSQREAKAHDSLERDTGFDFELWVPLQRGHRMAGHMLSLSQVDH